MLGLMLEINLRLQPGFVVRVRNRVIATTEHHH